MLGNQNLKQVKAFHDESRHRYLCCGRRGGKTTLIVEEILRAIANAPRRAEAVYFGPTNAQAMEVVWEPLEDAIEDLGWKCYPRSSKKCFYLPNRKKIYIYGAENIKRVRGHALAFAALDELAFWETDLDEAWKAIRPTLSDLKGRALAATTPNGKGTQAYDWWVRAKSHKLWSAHHWITLDNPYIDPEEVEEAKYDLDELSYQQEYMATWETFASLAYYNFDENLHIKKQKPIDYDQPIQMCFDFNVNPTTILLRQKEGTKLSYKKEYSIKNSSTEDTVERFCEDFKQHRNSINIRIRGDATGKNRSSPTGKSDYYYVQEILKSRGFSYRMEVSSKNPPIIDRVKYVNGWLKPISGSPKIEVDPSMKDLIKDLSSQPVDDNRKPSDKNNLGHKSDALGYDVYYEHLSQNRKPQATVRL